MHMKKSYLCFTCYSYHPEMHGVSEDQFKQGDKTCQQEKCPYRGQELAAAEHCMECDKMFPYGTHGCSAVQKPLELVKKFHQKFQAPILAEPSLIPEDRSNNRYHLMRDEVEEYLKSVRSESLTDIAKELADILYVVYGTILEHGLQDEIDAIFEEVHNSNMSKDHHEYKMLKGPDYFPADIEKFLKPKKAPKQN